MHANQTTFCGDLSVTVTTIISFVEKCSLVKIAPCFALRNPAHNFRFKTQLLGILCRSIVALDPRVSSSLSVCSVGEAANRYRFGVCRVVMKW